MLWLFLMLLFQDAAIQEGDSCGTPRYLNKFTYHPDKFIYGSSPQYIRVLGNKETLRATCKEYCLNYSLCKSYEVDDVYNGCDISNYDMYHIPLFHSERFDFYNRVYDCGCPPSQGANVINRYTSTTDGSSLNILCSIGYKNDALPTTLTCTSDGWGVSANIYSCTALCSRPTNVPNATHNGTLAEYEIGDTISYTCNTGYVNIDTKETDTFIQCQNDGTWGDVPICIMDCGPPENIQNAVVTSGDIFTPGQSVEYTCNSGFLMSDTKLKSKKIICKGDGMWENYPSCIVNCGTAPSVLNSVVTSGSVFIPGESVFYTCNPSYIVEGTKQSVTSVLCQNDGTWASTPRCIKDCGPSTKVANSSNNAVGTVFVHGDTVIYTCESGSVMLGTHSTTSILTCEDDGFWQNAPQCTVNCGPPPSVQHATKSNQGYVFTPGDYITWTCDDRYVVQATNILSENVICKSDGTWTTKPSCVAYCGKHPDVDHAKVQGTGGQQGDSRTYTCSEGHTMVGSAVIQCQNNSTWEKTPICPADCGDPPVLGKGRLTGLGNLENDTRNATCGNGYVLEGKSIIKCQMNGQWEDLPQCTATEVHRFKQSMFGAEKSPISQQTGIAMSFAIVFGLLLIGIGSVYCYNLCKQKRKDKENKLIKSSKENGQFNINGSLNASAEDNLYLPAGRTYMYKTDRSWREIFF